MILHLKELAVAAGLAGVGLGVVYLALRRSLRRAIDERQQATGRQLAEMADTIKSLEARLAELSPTSAKRLSDALGAAPGVNINASAYTAEQAPLQESHGIAPETLAVITAAVTAFLGANVRVRSASLMPPSLSGASAWSQQGRVFVQASHNIRTRR